MIAKELLNVITAKGLEPRHYAKAYASYVDAKTRVTRELQEIFTNLYRLGGLYNDDGSINEEVFSKDYWNVPIFVKPVAVNNVPGVYDDIMITGLMFAKAINDALGNEDPTTSDLPMSDINEWITWDELCSQDDIDTSALKSGNVTYVTYRTNCIIEEHDGTLIEKGSIVEIEVDDLVKNVRAYVEHVPLITINLPDSLMTMTESVIKTDSVIAILDSLGSNLQLSPSDVQACLQEALGRFQNYKTYVDDRIVNIASNASCSMEDRINQIMSILNSEVDDTDESQDNTVYYDGDIGFVFNANAYTGTSATAMWNASATSSVVKNILLTTGRVVAAVGKALFEVTKQVAKCVARLWRKYITPAYQSKDFVKSDYDTVDKFVDVPTFVYGNDQSGYAYSKDELIHTTIANLNTPVTKHGGLNLNEVSVRQTSDSVCPILSYENSKNEGLVTFEVAQVTKAVIQDQIVFDDDNYYTLDMGLVDMHTLDQQFGEYHPTGPTRIFIKNDAGAILYDEVDQIGRSSCGLDNYGMGQQRIKMPSYLYSLQSNYNQRSHSYALSKKIVNGRTVTMLVMRIWLNGVDDYLESDLFEVPNSFTNIMTTSVQDQGPNGYNITNERDYTEVRLRFNFDPIYDRAQEYTLEITIGGPYAEAWYSFTISSDMFTGDLFFNPLAAGWMYDGTAFPIYPSPEQQEGSSIIQSDYNEWIITMNSRTIRTVNRVRVITVPSSLVFQKCECGYTPCFKSPDGSQWRRGNDEKWLNVDFNEEWDLINMSSFPSYETNRLVTLTYRPEYGSNQLLVLSRNVKYDRFTRLPSWTNEWSVIFKSENSKYANGVSQFEWSNYDWTWYSAPVSELSENTIRDIIGDASNPIPNGTALVMKSVFACVQIVSNGDSYRCMMYPVPCKYEEILNSDGSWRFTVDQSEIFFDGQSMNDNALESCLKQIFENLQSPRDDYDAEKGDITAYKDLYASRKLIDLYVWCVNHPNNVINDYFDKYSTSGYLLNHNMEFNLSEVNNAQFISVIYNEELDEKIIQQYIMSVVLKAITNKPKYVRAYYLLTGEYPEFEPYLIGDRLNSPQWHISTDSDIQSYVDKMCTMLIITAAVIAAAILLKVGSARIKKFFKKRAAVIEANQLKVNQDGAQLARQTEEAREILRSAGKKKDMLGPNPNKEDKIAYKQLVTEAKQTIRNCKISEIKNAAAKIKLDRKKTRWVKIAGLFGVSCSAADVAASANDGEGVLTKVINTTYVDGQEAELGDDFVLDDISATMESNNQDLAARIVAVNEKVIDNTTISGEAREILRELAQTMLSIGLAEKLVEILAGNKDTQQLIREVGTTLAESNFNASDFED